MRGCPPRAQDRLPACLLGNTGRMRLLPQEPEAKKADYSLGSYSMINSAGLLLSRDR